MPNRRSGGVCRRLFSDSSSAIAILILLLGLFWSASAQAFEPVDCETEYPYWSDSDPKLNLVHIFCGEINSRDQPVGFHARPRGEDPVTARVAKIRDVANAVGVYTASVEILDDEHWKEKFSSLFPDRLGQRQVVRLILSAYKDSGGGQQWEGKSGAGFRIQGYEIEIDGETRINTAYPLYQR